MSPRSITLALAAGALGAALLLPLPAWARCNPGQVSIVGCLQKR